MRRVIVTATVVAAGTAGAGAALWLRRRSAATATPREAPAPSPSSEAAAANGHGPAEAVLERTGPSGDPRGDGLAPGPDDGLLTDRVRSALGRHPLGAHLNVNVEFGTVVLRGEVPADDDIVDLGAAAEAVEGVTRVDNRLHRHGSPPPLEDATG